MTDAGRSAASRDPLRLCRKPRDPDARGSPLFLRSQCSDPRLRSWHFSSEMCSRSSLPTLTRTRTSIQRYHLATQLFAACLTLPVRDPAGKNVVGVLVLYLPHEADGRRSAVSYLDVARNSALNTFSRQVSTVARSCCACTASHHALGAIWAVCSSVSWRGGAAAARAEHGRCSVSSPWSVGCSRALGS